MGENGISVSTTPFVPASTRTSPTASSAKELVANVASKAKVTVLRVFIQHRNNPLALYHI